MTPKPDRSKPAPPTPRCNASRSLTAGWHRAMWISLALDWAEGQMGRAGQRRCVNCSFEVHAHVDGTGDLTMGIYVDAMANRG